MVAKSSIILDVKPWDDETGVLGRLIGSGAGLLPYLYISPLQTWLTWSGLYDL